MLRTMTTGKVNTVFRQHICNSSTWQDVKIPVPWGHIGGKWWGPQEKRPILAVHGWQDNSGSFDRLIPLLPKTSSFLAIDFPGCGYSSKMPPGVFYHLIDLTILLRRIVKYFGWSKVSLLGHSMGGGISYAYTILYPNEVDFLICLDMLKPVVEDKSIDEISKNLDYFLKYDHYNNINKKPPCYSLEEMEERLHKSFNSVEVDKCKYILQRNVEASDVDPTQYYFTVDPRLKIYSLLDFPQKFLLENAHRISCPMLYCKTSMGDFFEKKEYVFEIIDVIKQNNNNMEVHFVEGAHHVHLNNPQVLEGILNAFLQKYDVCDRAHAGLKEENIV